MESRQTRITRRRFVVGAGGGAAGLVLAASAPAALRALAADQKVKVAWSMASMEVQSYQVAKAVVEKDAPTLNAEVFWTDAHNDQAQQVADVDNLLARKPDVMLIHPVDANAVAPLFIKAKAKKIPVLLFQRPARTTEFDLFVGGGTYDEGVLMGDFVGKQLGAAGGNVILINGDVGNDNAHNIHKGNVDALKKYPAIKVVLDQPSPLWSREKAQNIAEDALVKFNGDVKAIICANDDMAGGVAQALASKELTGKVILVGGDGDRDAMQRIQQGSQSATCLQSFITLPREALKVAVGLARGSVDISKTFKKEVIAFDPEGEPVYRDPVPYTLISKENVAVLEQYWQDVDAYTKK